MFTFKNINNGTLRSTKSMPQKDITSDNQSTFSMGRRKYVRTLGVDTTLVNNNIPDTIRKNIQKKWYGSSSTSDSSRVLNKRVNNEVGNGSLNSSRTSMSFTSDSAIVPAIFNLNAIDGSGSATLTFNIDNGGSLITNYQYAINGINSGNFKSIGPSINNPYLIPDSLIPGNTYKIYLKAFNKLGEGASDTSVVPSTKPLSAPTIASLDYTNSIITYTESVGETTRTAYFTPIPPSTGSGIGWSSIVSYKLLVKDSASNILSTYVIPSGSRQLISGLKVITDYKLSLSAFNKNGEGPYSTDTTINITAVPPYNINLGATILVDASDIFFYDRAIFTNVNVPKIDISFAITAAPTNTGGSAIIGYNYNCPNITSTLSSTISTNLNERNVITLNLNTLNTINIYARNNIGIAPIPKQITYYPIIPPPKPIILSASLTSNSFIVTFMNSNAYPSYYPINGYNIFLECPYIPNTSTLPTIPITQLTTTTTYTMNVNTCLLTSNARRTSTTNSIEFGVLLRLRIKPTSTLTANLYPSTTLAQTNNNYVAYTNSFMYGTPPILTGASFIPGDKKVVLYDFILNNSVSYRNDYVVYSYSLDNRNWSTTDLFVNVNLPDNENSYNLYLRAHNMIGISTPIIIEVKGKSKPDTPNMAVYSYNTGVLLVATPGTYVSKYLDEVIYSYDKYSVTYSYSFNGSDYTNFPVYSTPANKRQVFIPIGSLPARPFNLHLISTSITSLIPSTAVSTSNITLNSSELSLVLNSSGINTQSKLVTIGNLKYRIFPNNGLFDVTCIEPCFIEVLMIGGGGGGGIDLGTNCGGGGAGEVLNGFIKVYQSGQYAITVPNNKSSNGDDVKIVGSGGSGLATLTLTANGGISGSTLETTGTENPYGSGGGGSYSSTTSGNFPGKFSNRSTTTSRNYVTGTNIVSGTNNVYMFSYGGNVGSNLLITTNKNKFKSGCGGGSGTPGINTGTLWYGGAGTNKFSDWIMDISSAMDEIVTTPFKWSSATIKNGVGYIASGGVGQTTDSFTSEETIDQPYNPYLTTSQVFEYGGGGTSSKSAINNTGGGQRGGFKASNNGLIVFRYYA